MDVVGRGDSDYLPKEEYNYPQYIADMNALIARLDVDSIQWLGTSMGGLIGMFMAGMKGSPISRLVMNDVGPFMPAATLERIKSYSSGGDENEAEFDSLDEFENYLRRIYEPFGLSDPHWKHLAKHGHKVTESGKYRKKRDPHVGYPIASAPPGDLVLWFAWDMIPAQMPIMVLRGERSDLLDVPTFDQMCQRPHTTGHVIPNVGHAPCLMTEPEIQLVRDFLQQ